MSTNNKYQPKYSVGHEYKAGNAQYLIQKIENGMYYQRCSAMPGWFVTRCDVFDANHNADRAVSVGIGLPPHPENK